MSGNQSALPQTAERVVLQESRGGLHGVKGAQATREKGKAAFYSSIDSHYKTQARKTAPNYSTRNYLKEGHWGEFLRVHHKDM